jgi:putative ABC transport system permease protein
MKIIDVIIMSSKGLSERKFRFALNLIGILIGCAAITGLISITQGLSSNVNSQLEVFGPQNINLIPGNLQSGRIVLGSPFTWRDLEIVEKTDGVEKVTPMVAYKSCTFIVKGSLQTAQVYGLNDEYFDINKNMQIDEGRFLSRTDVSTVILGSNIAHPPDEDELLVKVGDRIKVTFRLPEEEKTMTFRVVGILKETGGGIQANIDDSIGIPLKTAQQIYEMNGRYDIIIAKARSIEEVNVVAENLEERLGDDVIVMSYEHAKSLIGQVLGTIESVLSGIAAISLIVAGVGIVNTMTVSVLERTKEIGTLKAIGAKSRDVLFMFLSEAALTGLLGGLIGATFGFLISKFIGDFIGLEIVITYSLGLSVVAFAIITSIISGLYPAWRASSLNPVDALRKD